MWGSKPIGWELTHINPRSISKYRCMMVQMPKFKSDRWLCVTSWFHPCQPLVGMMMPSGTLWERVEIMNHNFLTTRREQAWFRGGVARCCMNLHCMCHVNAPWCVYIYILWLYNTYIYIHPHTTPCSACFKPESKGCKYLKQIVANCTLLQPRNCKG
jgi:hypothetical protein